ncbi:DNA-binding transcriptional regulator of sugar metabolism, DeoR/GlpR family [Pseudovibrio sp. Tun.PSC04-5.I4]|nr:DNA-binding transcriptional regulator of sugar metabolism, DeoR/GlpR family [Pseudovibrio sp. Tun.PSC04-5.I4]
MKHKDDMQSGEEALETYQMSDTEEFSTNPRQEMLVNLVNENQYASVEQLAAELSVSTQTIRRDIRKLSELKLLARYHGGVARRSSVVNVDYEVRQTTGREEKESIAQTVVDQIEDNSTVFLSIGSTIDIIAKQLLKRKGLRVITNSLNVAHLLYTNSDFELLIPGGRVRSRSSGVIGHTALDYVRQFRVDYLVMSLGAIAPDGMMLDYDFNEVSIVKAVMERAHATFVAMEAKKFSTKAAVEIGHISNIDVLFTDEDPPSELMKIIQSHNVTIKIC